MYLGNEVTAKYNNTLLEINVIFQEWPGLTGDNAGRGVSLRGRSVPTRILKISRAPRDARTAAS